MVNWVKAAKRQDIDPGTGVVAQCGAVTVALFNVEGELHAVQNTCPHRGGPLGEGELNGQVVTCPWHAWSFDVCSGVNVDDPNSKLACYPVKIENEDVLVEV